MTKIEFEELAGKEIAEAEWKMIEAVYTWHPAISETKGKKQVCAYWTAGLIADLYPRAAALIQNDQEITRYSQEMEALRNNFADEVGRLKEKFVSECEILQRKITQNDKSKELCDLTQPIGKDPEKEVTE